MQTQTFLRVTAKKKEGQRGEVADRERRKFQDIRIYGSLGNINLDLV